MGFFCLDYDANSNVFVEKLSEVLNEYGKKEDLFSMMTEVSRRVAYATN